MAFEKICPICNNSFRSKPSESKIYCSVECYHAKGRRKETCCGCGIEFECAKHTKKRSRNVFCSHSCYIKNKGGHETIVTFSCTHCGQEYGRALGELKWHDGNRFCSRSCHREWQKTNELKGKDRSDYKSIQVACASCGNLIERQPYRIRDYEKQFCNKKCAGKWRSANHLGVAHPRWKGGKLFYYGVNWYAQSAKARKRDNYRCQHCGITQKKNGRKLDVHHLIPFRSFGYIVEQNDNYLQANDLANLISLCRSCHMNAEARNIPLQPMMLWTDE